MQTVTPLALTPNETALLRVLMDNRGRVVPRAQLLTLAFGYPAGTRTRTLDVHIQHLRRKLGAAGSADKIQTVFGVGYRMAS